MWTCGKPLSMCTPLIAFIHLWRAAGRRDSDGMVNMSGSSLVGKLYFMYSTCCAVCLQPAQSQPTPRSDTLAQSPSSYNSRLALAAAAAVAAAGAGFQLECVKKLCLWGSVIRTDWRAPPLSKQRKEEQQDAERENTFNFSRRGWNPCMIQEVLPGS